MANAQQQLANTLQGLQATANRCARAFTTTQLKVEYRVAFSAGDALPWRLMEVHRAVEPAGMPRVLRRMHCFRSAEFLARSVKERASWKARDQALVASHLVRVRASKDHSTQDKSGSHPSVRPDVDLRVLTPARLKLRAQMCLTVPDRVVDLP